MDGRPGQVRVGVWLCLVGDPGVEGEKRGAGVWKEGNPYSGGPPSSGPGPAGPRVGGEDLGGCRAGSGWAPPSS